MIIAIIQARMGSSRLPGKVLLDLAGRPVLWHGVERVRRARSIDRVMVATTDQPGDEPIRQFCREKGIPCFAGSETDVLDRYYQAAIAGGAGESDGIARITADCPLIDPDVIDQVVEIFLTISADYVSNVQPPTFPDGLDVEVFKFSSLRQAHREARLLSEREHVTPYLRNQPEKFSQRNVTNGQDLSSLRWTLDEPADYALLQRIVTELDVHKPDFHMSDVLQILSAHPEWAELNCSFARNEGYLKSLRQDGAPICLGTVQFGTAYGINNRLGQPDRQRVFAILDRAIEAGIDWLDTAAAYGEAESVLGEYIRSRQAAGRLRVVSKLRPDFLDNTSKGTISVSQIVKNEMEGSLQRLGLERFDGYLLHNAAHLDYDEVGLALTQWRAAGLTRKIGVSVYTPEQALAALHAGWVDAVQVPYNILDRRLDQRGFFDEKSRLGRSVTVFVRSLLLQGLLMMTEADVPTHLAGITPHLKELDGWLSGYGFSRFDAAFWFASRRPGVDAVVLGVDTVEQLEQYIQLSHQAVDFSAALTEGLQRFGDIDSRLLSPNLWDSLRTKERDEDHEKNV
ncbi:MAG TPA: aldo/keto reductase [Negativicutes bacterium]|nr:aldo/keto reductase [Negativicutes bacterium]